MENKTHKIQSIADFNFSSEFNTQIENFSSENATFPQNDGKLFRRASQN